MGCAQSSTAAKKNAAGQEQTAASANEGPVLTEVTAEERALAQLKLIFDGVDANEDGGVSKAELTNALAKDENLGALIKEAGLSQKYNILDQLDTNKDGCVTWDEFRTNLKEAAVQEVKETGNVAAAELPADEKVLRQLKSLFESLDANEDGGVSKEELATGLKKGTDEHGLMKDDSLGKLIEQAGFNPHWCVLEQLDTNKDGRITWGEFEAHLRSAAKEEVKEKGDVMVAVMEEEEIVVQSETVSPQSFWKCC